MRVSRQAELAGAAAFAEKAKRRTKPPDSAIDARAGYVFHNGGARVMGSAQALPERIDKDTAERVAGRHLLTTPTRSRRRRRLHLAYAPEAARVKTVVRAPLRRRSQNLILALWRRRRMCFQSCATLRLYWL